MPPPWLKFAAADENAYLDAKTYRRFNRLNKPCTACLLACTLPIAFTGSSNLKINFVVDGPVAAEFGTVNL